MTVGVGIGVAVGVGVGGSGVAVGVLVGVGVFVGSGVAVGSGSSPHAIKRAVKIRAMTRDVDFMERRMGMIVAIEAQVGSGRKGGWGISEEIAWGTSFMYIGPK